MSVKIGLALGGGGARGLAHIGVLKVLEKENIPIYQITGCSMGALVGSAYAFLGNAIATENFMRDLIASPPFQELDIEIFSAMDRSQVNSHLDYYLNGLKKYFSLLKTLNRASVYEEKGINKIFELYPDILIEDLPLRFACIATDLISGREIVLNEGSLRKAVMASASIPGIFPPVKIDNLLLVDGSVTDSIPVQIVKGQGPQYVFAVDVTKSLEDVDPLDNALKIINRAEDIVSYYLTQERLAGADLVIRPKVHNYSWSEIRHLDKIIEAGETAALEVIPQIRQLLGE